MIPPLHLVTDDAVLRSAGLADLARRIMAASGADIALHLRGHGCAGRELYDLAAALLTPARGAGATGAAGDPAADQSRGAAIVLVNDRIDVAMMTRAAGVQLGRRSLPVKAARGLLGGRATIGYSAHSPEEAAVAVEDGADFVLAGAVYATASHPGAPGAGPDLIAAIAGRVAAPVVAVGGITPSLVPEALAAGASGVAVLSGVWRAADPLVAVAEYLHALGALERTGGRRSG